MYPYQTTIPAITSPIVTRVHIGGLVLTVDPKETQLPNPDSFLEPDL